jgi:hypothetical protein
MAKSDNNTPNKELPKVCFIITPLGEPNSETRRKADGLIAAVIRPVLEKIGYSCLPPHEIDTSGSITIQIVKHILEAPLVIANLTDLNPNVMYELAIRHAAGLPVVSVVETGTKLPFDLAAERTFFYENDMAGVEELKKVLTKAILSAETDSGIDNPIYRATKESSIIKQINADNSENNVQKFIIEKIDDLSNKIASLASNNSRKEKSYQQQSIYSPQKYSDVIIKIKTPARSVDLKGVDSILSKAFDKKTSSNWVISSISESEFVINIYEADFETELRLKEVINENGWVWENIARARV